MIITFFFEARVLHHGKLYNSLHKSYAFTEAFRERERTQGPEASPADPVGFYPDPDPT